MKKVLIVGSLALLLASCSPETVPKDEEVDLTKGLAAYYPFNENANDESLNENNGTVNGPTLTEDRFGNPDNAYLFDGIDDYILTEYTPSQNLGGNLTITLWMNWRGDSGQRFNGFDGQRFVAKWAEGNAGSREYCFSIWEGDFRLGVAGENANADTVGYSSEGVQPVENEWTFVTVTHSGNEAKMYINNQMVSTTEISSFSGTTGEADDEPIIIGGGCSSGDMPVYIFNGALDDIRLYNRVLSGEEITQLFNETE